MAAKEHGAFLSVWVALQSGINKIFLTIYPGSSMWRMLRYSCYSSKTFFWGASTEVNTNDRLGVNGTVATVAVARGFPNPIAPPLEFALGSL